MQKKERKKKKEKEKEKKRRGRRSWRRNGRKRRRRRKRKKRRKGKEDGKEEAIIKHHFCPHFPLVSSSRKCYRDSRGGVWELHPSTAVGYTHTGGAIFGKYSLLVCVRKAALTSRKHHGRPC